MEFITVNDIPVAYQIINPNADKTIFFIHGNSQSHNAWQKQLFDPLFNDYRLIAFDLPAHGESGFPDTEYCTLPGLATMMYEAVTSLSNQQPYILIGISLGTNIIAEMLANTITPVGMVLAGPCITDGAITMAQMMKPGTQVGVLFTDDAAAEAIRQYAQETSLSTEAADIDCVIKNYMAVQKPFRSLLGQSIVAQKVSNEIALLQQQAIPLLLVFGKDERIIHTGYLDNAALPLWNDTIYQLPGASHLVNIDQPEAFNKLLARYVTEQFK